MGKSRCPIHQTRPVKMSLGACGPLTTQVGVSSGAAAPAPPRPLGGSAEPIGPSAACRPSRAGASRSPSCGRRGMDPQEATGQGSGDPSARQVPSAEVSATGWGARAPATPRAGSLRARALQEGRSPGKRRPHPLRARAEPGRVHFYTELDCRRPIYQKARLMPDTTYMLIGSAGFAAAGQETETEMAMDRLASGAQSIPNDIPAHNEGPSLEEDSFAVEEREANGELYAWELSEGPPMEQAADLFTEDWDLELKADQGNPYDADDIQGSISQEIKPWVCCAPQGDMMYDPSWHHPPPLIPHYSKMVFETGQFDDAED
ncbi:coordinator of PRMT5 and differentiation stimulator [Phodopus roborovskii]|nr:coordinator of PRMT5 and differentiation stimulator [Phodopus roborovskii]